MEYPTQSPFPPFHPVVPAYLQSPASSFCCAHHLVFQGAPLPLLNLSFRTQTKGHFLLKIFPDLSLGWVGTPSPKHPISMFALVLFCQFFCLLITNISLVFFLFLPLCPLEAPYHLLRTSFPLLSSLISVSVKNQPEKQDREVTGIKNVLSDLSDHENWLGKVQNS